MKDHPIRALGRYSVLLVFALALSTANATAQDTPGTNRQREIKRAVDLVIQPMMAKYGIPGVAVGVISRGKPYVFNYGVASTETKKPVTQGTLFEIGSISKTFTATLATYAQISGNLSLSDKTSKYLLSLRGSKFGDVSLLNLGTHTPGGQPLQVPDNVHNNDELLQYFKDWVPKYAPGTYRTYGNPGIGTLGLITAKSMGQDFTALMEQRVLSRSVWGTASSTFPRRDWLTTRRAIPKRARRSE
jgi:beta-lactamase class C